jgi:uncharacterized protein (TIGR02679 family)
MTSEWRGRSEEKARQYFNRPGFRRMLSLLWKRYEVLERIGGQITVGRAQEEECEAINAFLGKYYRPGQSILLKLEDFQNELRESAFPFSIPELHQIIEGFPLLTRSEKNTLRQKAWTQMFTDVKEHIGEEPAYVRVWLRQLHEGSAPGYRTLLEQFRIDHTQAGISIQHAAKSLCILFSSVSDDTAISPVPSTPLIRLPYLAVMATGDSHALDWKRPAGRLLYYALRDRRMDDVGDDLLQTNLDEMAHEEDHVMDTLTMREVYRSSGIADDDLSAIVHIYIPLIDHLPVPSVWTLRQIELMKPVPNISAIYVVENPAVFSMLLDASNDRLIGIREGRLSLNSPMPMLVCSSGPASAAALRLFRIIIEESSQVCPIFYSGDFDVKGLEMGVVLANRFPEQFNSWRFDVSTYLESRLNFPNGPEFSKTELNRLFQYKVPWDTELTLTMYKQGHKIFKKR